MRKIARGRKVTEGAVKDGQAKGAHGEKSKDSEPSEEQAIIGHAHRVQGQQGEDRAA